MTPLYCQDASTAKEDETSPVVKEDDKRETVEEMNGQAGPQEGKGSRKKSMKDI